MGRTILSGVLRDEKVTIKGLWLMAHHPAFLLFEMPDRVPSQRP